MHKLTTEQFIQKAKLVHFDKYNYNPTLYENAKTKVTINCPVHGDFEQLPSNHLTGFGCMKCAVDNRANNKRKSFSQFVEDANNKHNNKYVYPEQKYISCNVKIKIICKIHGEFLQTPTSHLNGRGCPTCAGKNENTESFIQKVKGIHNNKYDYSKVNYISAKTNVIIICPEHGEFQQTPDKHKQGQGCKVCGNIKNSDYHRDTLEVFLDKVNKVFPDYNYDKVEYTLSSNKIKVECKKHGIFEITPNNLISGHGCPKCKTSKGELKILKYLEGNNINYIYQHKVNHKNKDFYIDFYIPTLNIAIEFNGKQHYEYIPFFHKGGILDLEKQMQRDEDLLMYCNINNIDMKIIKYDDDIILKLDEIIFKNKNI